MRNSVGLLCSVGAVLFVVQKYGPLFQLPSLFIKRVDPVTLSKNAQRYKRVHFYVFSSFDMAPQL